MVPTFLLLWALSGCTSLSHHSSVSDGFAAAMRGDQRAALDIFARIAEENPDTMEGALAHDAAIEITGQRLFPEHSYPCSQEAVAQYTAAERDYFAGAMDPALKAYQRAVELCPNNAIWWVMSGDAYFGQGEYEHAKTLYLRALELDPWNRTAHRFLADANARLGAPLLAYKNAVSAVVSDPTYETGWQFLKEIVRSLGGQWNRRFGFKPHIALEDGRPSITLSDRYENQSSLTVWTGYALMRSTFVMGGTSNAHADTNELHSDLPSPAAWNSMSPLERERILVAKSLAIYQRLTVGKEEPEAEFWETFEKASRAGFLDEAIYMHLMDRDLAASYPDYRAKNADRLAEYVAKIVAPVSPSGAREV